MSTAPKDLVAEFRKEVKDKRRGVLVDAYITKPTADAMAAKALELLKEDIDAIENP
jgi:hypothetical protein